jgi:peptidoglycan/LPS O-acetylase OafA/YrhL
MLGPGFTLVALAFAGFMVALLRADAGDAVRKLLACAPMRYVGLRSYGVYLYHFPVFAAFDALREPGAANFVAVNSLRWGVTFLVAELSYRTIEAWARRRRHDSAIRSSIQTPV